MGTARQGHLELGALVVSFLAGRRATIASYVVLVLVVATAVVYVVRSDGYARHRADLNDGVIWVSNDELAAFGRFNKPIDELDGAAHVDPAGRADYDVVQQGAAVLGFDASGRALYAIDVAKSSVPSDSSAHTSPQASVVLNGGSVGVVDRASGKIWATSGTEDGGIGSISDLDQGTKPLATVGGDAAVTVTADGTVVAVSGSTGQMVRLPFVDGQPGKPVVSTVNVPAEPAVTAVGDRVVLLDPRTGQVSVDGRVVSTVGRDAVLQQVGPAATDVLVETPTDLISVDLDSGRATSLAKSEVTGRPTPPVRLGACSYGAWSSAGGPDGYVAVVCGDDVPHGGPVTPATDVVLRSNRGQVVLNDRESGAVWNIDDIQPEQVDNWDGFRPDENKNDDQSKQHVEDPDPTNQPPRASDDRLGARPGTTTVLHVLDNDQAPEGTLLAIRQLTSISDADAAARISPDAQTVLLTVPEGDQQSQVRFSYIVDAGSAKVAKADVTVPLVGPDSHSPPRLRPEAVKDRPDYAVPARGSITLAPVGDWRDEVDGDAVAVSDATVNAGSVHVTADGRIRYDAPATGGIEQIHYTVTDSDGEQATDVLRVQVQGPAAYNALPATAEPDVASGVVGQPLVVDPLDNDVNGSDPLHPDAQLELAAPVGSVAGLQVRTDMNAGRLTLTASRPGTFLLSYRAAFGDAAPSVAVPIRVDVRPAQGAEAPITVPDAVTLYGTAPAVVDVLANDFDPRGLLLTVQDVKVAGPAEPLEVSVVEGHWVRLRAADSLNRNPLTIHYTVTNGDAAGVQGDLVVRYAPPVDDDEPVTVDDRAVVRAGSSVAVPVLDNDFTPSGAPVSLAPAASGLVVEPSSAGRAFVSGRQVRFVATSAGTARDGGGAGTVDVTYLASNADGVSREGTLHVTVTPPVDAKTNPDQAPTPPTVDVRVVSGDTLKIKIPMVGTDPDGDPVTATGIGSGPRLGRILGFGATQLEYQAFPSASGTDSFEYQVQDPAGETGTGTIRVAVVEPGGSLGPVAVDDVITAAPGRHVTVPVMANDYLGSQDQVAIEDLGKTNAGTVPGDAVLRGADGPIEAVVGPDDGRPATVRYALADGLNPPSMATLTIRSQAGYNNPPVVRDAFGQLSGRGDTVTVDVLTTAYDPDGSSSDLKVVKVSTAPGAPPARVQPDGKVTLRLEAHPQVVPFEVADKDGGRSTASIYVPADSGQPRVVSGATIEVDPGGKTTVDLSRVAVAPSGKTLTLGLRRNLIAAPSGQLAVEAVDDHTLRVTSLDPDYTGPGAVTFEVKDAASYAKATTAVLTVPVQVGRPTPVFRCPTTPIEVVQGGPTLTVDVASLCHVWTPDPADLGSLRVHGAAGSGLNGVEVSDTDGSVITIQATGGAQRTSKPGMVEVSAPGTSARGEIPVVVVEAGPPTLAPVRIDGVKAGETRTVDLASSFYSPLGDAVPRVVSITQTSPGNATASPHGSSVSITPNEYGRMSWRVVMTDVPGKPPADRQVSGTLSMNVLDKPGPPGRPTGASGESGRVDLSWAPADDHGSPVRHYIVSWTGGSKGSKTCGPATSCPITGLTNGEPYTFTVVAENAVGRSEPSAASRALTPDAVPGIVGAFTVGDPSNHAVPLSWEKPALETSIDGYVVTGAGQPVRTSATHLRLSLADNNRAYDITVVAVNKLGRGPTRTVQVQSSGRPATPAVSSSLADGSDGRARATVSWVHSDWEGKPGTYEVYRDGSLIRKVSSGQSSITDDIPYDGRSYVYSVKAVNSTGGDAHTSAAGKASALKAVGTPDPPTWTTSEATGANTMGRFAFKAGELRGTGGTYTLTTAKGSYSGPIGRNGSVGPIERATAENGSDSTPTVKICNAQKVCTDSVSGPSVRPYGPLSDASITGSSTGASGTSVSFSFTVDTNGRPATVRVTGNRGYDHTWTPDSRSITVSDSHSIGYSNDETFTVRISDPGRSEGSKQVTTPRTDPPPPPDPTVTVSQGGHKTVTGCTSSQCKYIKTTTKDFPGSVRCTANSSLGAGGFVTWGQGGNATREGPNVFGQPGGWVEVTCNGVSSGRTYWP